MGFLSGLIFANFGKLREILSTRNFCQKTPGKWKKLGEKQADLQNKVHAGINPLLQGINLAFLSGDRGSVLWYISIFPCCSVKLGSKGVIQIISLLSTSSFNLRHN